MLPWCSHTGPVIRIGLQIRLLQSRNANAIRKTQTSYRFYVLYTETVSTNQTHQKQSGKHGRMSIITEIVPRSDGEVHVIHAHVQCHLIHTYLSYTLIEESKYENVSSPLTRYKILPQGWRQRQGILSISSSNLLKLSWLTLPTFRPVSCSSGFRFTEILSLLF